MEMEKTKEFPSPSPPPLPLLSFFLPPPPPPQEKPPTATADPALLPAQSPPWLFEQVSMPGSLALWKQSWGSPIPSLRGGGDVHLERCASPPPVGISSGRSYIKAQGGVGSQSTGELEASGKG